MALNPYVPENAEIIKKPQSIIPRQMPTLAGGLIGGGIVPTPAPISRPIGGGMKSGLGADDGGLIGGGIAPEPTPGITPAPTPGANPADFYQQYRDYQTQAWNTAQGMNTQLPIGKVRSVAVAAAKGNKNDEQLKAELLAQGITPGSTVWNNEFAKLQRGESADITGAVTGAEIQGATFQAQQEAAKAGLLGNLAAGFGGVGVDLAGQQLQRDLQAKDLEMTDKWSTITNDQYNASLKAQQDMWTDTNSPINKLLSYFGVSGATSAKKTSQPMQLVFGGGT